MADGHRHPLHAFSSPVSSNFNSPATSLLANGIALNSLLTQLAATQPSSLSKTSTSASPTPRGMYGQGQQQGHNSRLNGAPNRGQGMPMLYNTFQQQSAHHHQAHAQHHQALQQDHGHGAGAGMMGHSAFASNVMSNTSPFSGANLQNGHGTTTRGGSAQQITDHWAEELRLHKESQAANTAMLEGQHPHYFARMKAAENRGIAAGPNNYPSDSSNDGGEEDRRRPYALEKNKRQDWHNLDISGQGLRVLSPALFCYDFLQELYMASNKLSHLPADIGKLRKLRYLDVSFNELTELPPEIGMCTSLKVLLLFENRIHDLPYEIGSLHNLEMLGIVGNPLSSSYKDEIMERGTKSLVNALLEQAPVPASPEPRKSIIIQEDVPSSLERVKTLTWNILCEKFATASLYGYTPTKALSWDYRKMKILQEIRESDADILCLQEIATDVFREFFSPELAQDDYKGVHWPRPKAKTMAEKDAQGVDGCAVFYKASKWILLDKQLIDYANIAINRPDMKNHHDIFNRVMPKDNIGLICFFESRQSGARMIIANTHLAWEPTLADVKLVQTAILMENITRLAEKYARWPPLKEKKMIQMPLEEGEVRREVPEPGPSQEYRNNTDIPLLVCGDYNSTKDSSVYELLSMGRVAASHSDFGKHQYGSFTRDGVAHPFSMRSAYVHLNNTPDELTFTNYVPNFAEVIDYIWYSTNTMEVVELLGPPDKNHLKRVPGFPNYHFPADHIQIVADFVIKARKDKKLVTEPDFGSGSSERRS
ncbi:glucose-repressible alcohol dehydrogenase transcriptional effector [Cladorrhinum sp. PSN332]|nr:glucose-repressible alcohol dehydrogenase transcriptional effector [Cladorrhinum sp. PSN332]